MQDPTRSKTLRSQYASRLRGWYGKLNSQIRDSIISNDVFGLQQSSNEDDPSELPNMSRMSSDRQIERFKSWLEQQERRGILEIISTDDNTYVRQAYSKGLKHADSALAEEGISVPEETVASMFNRPIHTDTLQRLFTRNYTELEGINNAMNQRINRELADGFSRGLNSTQIARNITDRVNDIGKRRAKQLAHSEVIRAHSDATLNRYEEMGVDDVTVQAEILTAGDRRVCPVCASLEGTTMTVQEAREGTFSFDGSSYPQKPPMHPMCRCAILPVT